VPETRVGPVAPIARLLVCTAALAWGTALSAAMAGDPRPAQNPARAGARDAIVPPAELDATFTRYCVGCHNDRARTAGLSLEGVGRDDVTAHLATLETVLRKLRSREMPPAGLPRPAPPALAGLVAGLERALDAVAVARPDPGAPALHRLNRAEYANAIRDLLGLDLDHARDLPPDDAGYGFDNVADVLTVSPLHMEKYLSSARRVSRIALGTAPPRPAVQKYASTPATAAAAAAGLPAGERGGLLIRHHAPFDADYTILVRLRGGRAPGLPPPRLDVRVDGRRVRLFEADFDTQEANQGTRNFELRLPLAAGSHEIAAGLLDEYAVAERGAGPVDGASVDYVLVGGPFDVRGPGDTESRRRVLVCRPETRAAEEPCARRILTALARRAYRRPVTAADVDPLLALFATGRVDGGRFEDGIELALSGVLVAPGFLFRVETPPDDAAPGTVYALPDLDLASRLSFFLWSSLPDEELLELAEAGRLREPDVLHRQVDRMLADPKARALVDNFAGQWLHLRNVDDWAPDAERFPDVDASLRYAFRRETELFLESLIREDRSVLEILDADYTFLNERLAGHYGIDGVEGDYFRRVALGDGPRGGVLTQGSVLMVTSYPTRTSPVLRGKWILENLLDAPPPAPPPDVPDLDERAAAASAASLREALERHRANPACATCHARLDPLGFALESFDAVGAYRTSEGGMPVEAVGALPDGTRLDGPAGLRGVLLARQDEFVEALGSRLLTYALGRGLEAPDRAAVRELRRRTVAGDHRVSALVKAVVDSVPFRYRRIPAP